MLGVDHLANNAWDEPFTTPQRRLVLITALLGILTLGHDVDHVRQGRGLPLVLYLVAVGAVVSIGTTFIVLLRYRAWSRPVAMVQGVTTVVGVGGGPRRAGVVALCRLLRRSRCGRAVVADHFGDDARRARVDDRRRAGGSLTGQARVRGGGRPLLPVRLPAARAR